MEITEKTFIEVMDLNLMHKARMHKIPTVLQRVQKFYCRPLTSVAACPTNCSQCKKTIDGIFTKISTADKKFTSYALFVYLLRQEMAKRSEAGSVKIPLFNKTVFGERVEVDPFEALLAVL